MWNVISGVCQERGLTVVLTTHSMEECEALCTRVGIMALGELRCIGSIQHLKNRFGQGYLLDVNTLPTRLCAVRDFVMRTFPQSKMAECHGGRVKFRIPKNVMSLAAIFKIMEQHKKALDIEDYSINQATLEQIFLSIARSAHADQDD